MIHKLQNFGRAFDLVLLTTGLRNYTTHDQNAGH